MTGSAADAEDIVQETFLRAIEKPPRDTESLRPWLIRVAMNLSRDFLRRRQRGYVGPWLPSPVPTDDSDCVLPDDPEVAPEDSPLARYGLLESVSFAFLLALEALTPSQRAVLLLRDVFDYSTTETAEALEISEGTVKVTLHRARRIMRDYDKDRAALDPARYRAMKRSLELFLRYLKERDAEGLERLLAKDVVIVTDGGGEVTAIGSPVRGRAKALQLLTRLTEVYRGSSRASVCALNATPAVLFRRTGVRPGHAPRITLHCETDADGRIRRLNYVLAPSKLTALRRGED
jgi:RNA polymerase sigma-70 factor (ECF subfamily)